jgi:hypothetical protein
MKAHVVKGDVFAVVFLLAARLCEAAASAAGWTFVLLASFPPVVFVLRLG